jgi:hypothetical protein
MFLDDPNDSKDEQRYKNMIFFKMWLTNDERDRLFESPLMGWMAIIMIILVVAGICAGVK